MVVVTVALASFIVDIIVDAIVRVNMSIIFSGIVAIGIAIIFRAFRGVPGGTFLKEEEFLVTVLAVF